MQIPLSIMERLLNSESSVQLEDTTARQVLVTSERHVLTTDDQLVSGTRTVSAGGYVLFTELRHRSSQSLDDRLIGHSELFP